MTQNASNRLFIKDLTCVISMGGRVVEDEMKLCERVILTSPNGLNRILFGPNGLNRDPTNPIKPENLKFSK